MNVTSARLCSKCFEGMNLFHLHGYYYTIIPMRNLKQRDLVSYLRFLVRWSWNFKPGIHSFIHVFISLAVNQYLLCVYCNTPDVAMGQSSCCLAGRWSVNYTHADELYWEEQQHRVVDRGWWQAALSGKGAFLFHRSAWSGSTGSPRAVRLQKHSTASSLRGLKASESVTLWPLCVQAGEVLQVSLWTSV